MCTNNHLLFGPERSADSTASQAFTLSMHSERRLQVYLQSSKNMISWGAVASDRSWRGAEEAMLIPRKAVYPGNIFEVQSRSGPPKGRLPDRFADE
jgi:hypothetical protein